MDTFSMITSEAAQNAVALEHLTLRILYAICAVSSGLAAAGVAGYLFWRITK